MSLSYQEAFQAAEDAERTLNNANILLRKTARMLAGRLRSSGVSHVVLCELKKELSKYNSRTGEWK